MRVGYEVARARSVAILGLSIAMIVLIGLGVRLALGSGADAAEGLSPLAPPEPGRPRPATVESAWPMAAARASEWDADARVFSLASQYDWPSDATTVPSEPAGGWLVYVFVAGNGEATSTLTIMVERNSAFISRETVTELGVDAHGFGPVEFEQAIVTSVQARDLAGRAGGDAFRDGCRSSRFTARQTFQPAADDANAAWLVTYADSRVRNGPALHVAIDAVSGATTVTPFGGADPSLDDLGPCSR